MAFSDWSTTAANNTNATTGVNFDDGQAPSTVNDSARELMAQLKGGVTHTLDRDVTQTTVDSTTTKTSVYSFSIPANTLGSTRGLRLTVLGDHLNNTGSTASTIFTVAFGGTDISTQLISVLTGATRRMWRLVSNIIAVNATDAQIAFTDTIVGPEGVTGSVTASNSLVFVSGHNALAIDTTSAVTISVSITHGTSSASQSTRCTAVLLELI